VHGKAVLLSVAEDTSRQKASSLLFQRRLLLLSFTALLLLLVMQIWVIRRGLKPLTGLKDELGRLERGETEVLQQQVPAEIAPLVDEINRLLSVLRQRLVRSRNSMGNLAHALKTPLTRMLQLLEHEPAKEDRQIIIELVRNIEQRVERELSRARMAGQTPGGFWPEPARDIRDLATTLEAINQKRTIIDLDIQDGLHIAADREDMMELIGNLLDNACKWARHRIRLRLSVEEGLCITIEDDGPGMDKAEQYEALNRGVRADESKPGHGLGLAIVRDIIAVYKGTLHMGSSNSLGGLRISIFLPDSAANVKQKS
jgi:signal transduction histidine kinase